MYQIWKLRSLIADWNDFVFTRYPIVKETRILFHKRKELGSRSEIISLRFATAPLSGSN
ncbi:MAG: hypothetical protein MRZ63_05935 [Anaerostipes sp.]|nr:hypothetical protein [Anaerostipes sp.]